MVKATKNLPLPIKLLHEEGLQCSQVGVAKFIKKIQDTGNMNRCVGSDF